MKELTQFGSYEVHQPNYNEFKKTENWMILFISHWFIWEALLIIFLGALPCWKIRMYQRNYKKKFAKQ